MTWIVAILLGCPKPAVVTGVSPDPVYVAGPSVVHEVVRVDHGVWESPDGALSLFLPEGWSGEQGQGDLLLKVRDATTGTELEIWSRLSTDLPERDDCSWTFRDNGTYRALSVPSEVATCVPEIYDAPYVFTRIVPLNGRAIHVLAAAPHGQWIAGRDAATDVMRTMRIDEMKTAF